MTSSTLDDLQGAAFGRSRHPQAPLESAARECHPLRRCMGTGAIHHNRGSTVTNIFSQNRQLFIQTDLYLGTLGFFLEEYGRHFERLDEARSWKIARELADVSINAVNPAMRR